MGERDPVGAPPTTVPAPPAGDRGLFPWLVLSLLFALLLSDFMCRQVLVAVFPLLKAQWGLTDTQLGALSSVVAVTVGVLALPLSMLADRFGRRRAILGMAAVWSLATLASALAANYGQLLAARVLIGVGEAAYGSVGLAVVLSVFPVHRRASMSGAFTAGGTFGSVLGVALGGALAVRYGWRWSVAAMAAIGLVLTLLYQRLVTDAKLDRHTQPEPGPNATPTHPERSRLATLLSSPAVVCLYLGGGLQLFVAGALLAWLPSYLNRAYGLPPGAAAGLASLLLLGMAVGMVGCGLLTDRLARADPVRTWTAAMGYVAASLLLLGVGFALPASPAQLVLIGAGAFFTAGTTGPAGALVAGLAPPAVRASAFGMLALAYNLLGLSTGPLVIGMLADRFGLITAMQLAPAVSLAVIGLLAAGRRSHRGSARRAATRP
ncbi:MFS transporter [Geodermatophilus sabuli]|uniref:Predicted arabinose efflux permease, MFS family n=1 Tax=Geodermatophilus sabuli TaxID=1564158 RepID=A0A285EDK8_9ACTN|nr:MFS transporter [Geodermatophilus sabuli]MBB3085406.1 putative MFS family arabinose efflux permease [Geodermatophilus sabuli]SNX96166.1 Predicted arabinose efflux permease, MFS family [Geodermatophilus sabuli]